MAKYVIIGNSAGAIGAAEAIREVDKEGNTIIISEEEYPAYSRPMISKFLSRECSVNDMLYRSQEFYESNSIAFMPGLTVSSLDLENRCVVVMDGKKIPFEKLLLATGSKPIIPNIGMKNRVYTFTNLKDAIDIGSQLETAKSAIVVGGGLIGVSATEALVKRGIQVTIVELRDRLLETILDENTSRLVEKRMETSGVKVVVGRRVVGVLSRPEDELVAGGIQLDDGSEIPADLIILAVGVSPRTELAESAGIKVGTGILVDRFMETSAKGVYACGDAAEAYDYLLGSNRPIPIWPLAYNGGRIAGFNMAGKSVEYQGGTFMNSMNYFGLPVVSIGTVNVGDIHGVAAGGGQITDGRYQTYVAQTTSAYRRLVFSTESDKALLVGVVLAGEIRSAGLYQQMIREKIPADHLMDSILERRPHYGLFLRH